MKKYFVYLYILVFFINIICIIAIWTGNPQDVLRFTKEDGIIENLSVIFYFLGIICCVIAISRRKFVRFSFIWLFLCIMFLGEETSWFQRSLNYSVPQIESINTQTEFNIHNLNFLQGKHLLDEQGHFHFDFRQMLDPQTLFRIGIFVYFLILPLTFHIRKLKSLLIRIGYPNPSFLFVLSMWGSIILSFILALFSDSPTRSALAETREMFYALFIFLYIFSFALQKRIGVKFQE